MGILALIHLFTPKVIVCPVLLMLSPQCLSKLLPFPNYRHWVSPALKTQESPLLLQSVFGAIVRLFFPHHGSVT